MRLRITYAKTGSLRYTGHLDLHRVWERTIRRAGLPLAYTQGFHPGPRLSIASALPLGFVGRAEIMDIWLKEEAPLDRPYKDLLQPAAPPGLVLLSVEPVDDHLPALQTQIISAEYEVTLLEAVSGSGLEQRVADLLAAASLPRERRGKPYDLRPLVLLLECTDDLSLRMTLSASEGATGRPEEVLDVLGIPVEDAHIERVRLNLKTI